ncbi:MAG: hypothetical protein R2705_13745 [Ilumatobacteraceae bacterium]
MAEAAVVGANDPTTGRAIIAYVTPAGRRRRQRGRPAEPRGQRDRADRQAQDDLLHAGSAQDPKRQDHAPAVA